MLNIILGLVMLIGGLTRTLALRGANSPELLAAIGAVMIAWGTTPVRRRYRRDEETDPARDPGPVEPPSETP